MLDMYRQNRVAVVDMVNNELKPFEIRDYVNKRMASKWLFNLKYFDYGRLSKYPKIYEWDETYGTLCEVACISKTLCI